MTVIERIFQNKLIFKFTWIQSRFVLNSNPYFRLLFGIKSPYHNKENYISIVTLRFKKIIKSLIKNAYSWFFGISKIYIITKNDN